jgi:hypothetical protein
MTRNMNLKNINNIILYVFITHSVSMKSLCILQAFGTEESREIWTLFHMQIAYNIHRKANTWTVGNMLCLGGETMSLNCGSQKAYCSSPRWYMSMETHGWIILTGENSWFVHHNSGNSTTRHLVAKEEEDDKGNAEFSEFCLRNVPFTHVGLLTCRKILRHGANGFTSPSKKVVLWISSALKIPSPLPASEPTNLGSKGKHAITRSPKSTVAILVVNYLQIKSLTW